MNHMNPMEPTRSFQAGLPGSTTKAAPMLQYYQPYDYNASGHVLVIFAGGGYQGRADHEGPITAHWFAIRGIASVVVDYRTAPDGVQHPAMLEDGLAAIHTVREMAQELGYDPNKLGVLGYSAGGHLAGHCLTAFNEFKGELHLRPDYGVLCYPVLHSQPPFAHDGSMQNLLGKESPSADERNEVDVIAKINPDTPPTFLWHAMGDESVPVENSLDFARSLSASKVPFELHCYEVGWHGTGLSIEVPWAEAAVGFIRRR